MPSVHGKAMKLPGNSIPGPFDIGFFHDPYAIKEILPLGTLKIFFMFYRTHDLFGDPVSIHPGFLLYIDTDLEIADSAYNKISGVTYVEADLRMNAETGFPILSLISGKLRDTYTIKTGNCIFKQSPTHFTYMFCPDTRVVSRASFVYVHVEYTDPLLSLTGHS